MNTISWWFGDKLLERLSNIAVIELLASDTMNSAYLANADMNFILP